MVVDEVLKIYMVELEILLWVRIAFNKLIRLTKNIVKKLNSDFDNMFFLLVR